VHLFRRLLLAGYLILIPFAFVYSQVPNLPQGVETERDPGPLFFDIHAGIHRIELGFSNQTSEKIITGLYYAFFPDVSGISDINSSDAILAKTRFYLGESINGWYVGPSAGVHDFIHGGVKGVFAVSFGLDHFFDVEFYYVRNTFRIGFYTEAGINTVGGAFAGAGIAIGI